MQKNLWFRAWFYFRQGWSMYFAFLFAAINTLTVTYYLAIEQLPTLKQIFPSFPFYVITVAVVGIPLLVTVGYIHYKKSPAFKAEAAINVEANPYVKRMMDNVEIMLKSQLKTTEALTKIIKNEKLTEKELTDLDKLTKELSDAIDSRLDTKHH